MNILIICSTPNAKDLVCNLKKLGQCAFYLPFIKYIPGKHLKSLPDKLRSLSYGDLIFFISKNSVFFSKNITELYKDIWPTYTKYYAIGKNTALEVQSMLKKILIEYPLLKENSESLVELPSLEKIEGKKALILKGNNGRNFLPFTLKKRGAKIIFCECYRRCYKDYNGIFLAQNLIKKKINTLVITSGEILKNFYLLFSHYENKKWILRCKLIVVSQRLLYLAKSLGWKDILVSKSANNHALLETLKYLF